jgi:large subunit ribosomal protein L32e
MAKDDIVKEFTKIKGIGKAKAEFLYDKGFNSLDKLKKATVNDLVKVEGITEAIAKNIKGQFKDEKDSKPAKIKDIKKEEFKKPKAKKEVKPKTEKKEELKEKQKKKEEKIKKAKETKKEEEEEPEEKEEKYIVKKKPIISNKQKDRLKLRKQIKKRKPEFLREEWFRYKRIQKNWRKPDGISSKMRRNLKYRPSMVRIGFRGPKETRGLHPSGFEEIVIFNIADLQTIDPKTQAARIGSSVGTKKRINIEKKAEELEVRILNK